MTYVGDRSLPGAILSAGPELPWNSAAQTLLPVQTMQPADGIGELFGAQPAAGSSFASPLGALLQQIVTLIQQFLGNGGGSAGFGTGSSANYFGSATASSTGDPHLAFNASHFDDMRSHGDLLSSPSFDGGYRLSTQVTAPAANGVTYNREAAVSTEYGQTSVSLDNGGNAAFTRNGQVTQIADGASYDLGNGESVHRDGNGTLVVTDRSAYGGSIQTVMSQSGGGVDVNVTATNVELGGFLVDRSE